MGDNAGFRFGFHFPVPKYKYWCKMLRHIYQKHVLKVNKKNKKGLTKSKTPTHVIAFHQFLKCMFLEDVHKYARDEQTQLNLCLDHCQGKISSPCKL